jgi:hypothetical protein
MRTASASPPPGPEHERGTMQHSSIIPACLRGTAVCMLAGAMACEPASGILVPGGGTGRVVQEVLVTPEGRTVQAGGTLLFDAVGIMSDGDTANISVDWEATGGTITGAGLFTAGQTAGIFRVTARASNGVTDSVGVAVTVPSANPPLVAVVVTPAAVTVATGGTAQFAAVGRLSNGASQAANITWTSTGGFISGSGLYTAGALPGTFRVVATDLGGLADTSAVTITGPGVP